MFGKRKPESTRNTVALFSIEQLGPTKPGRQTQEPWGVHEPDPLQSSIEEHAKDAPIRNVKRRDLIPIRINLPVLFPAFLDATRPGTFELKAVGLK